MKFTFKTQKPTGQWKAFENDTHSIKLDKKEVGTIHYKKPFTIRLMVYKNYLMEDGNPNCKWKWIALDHESESLKDAQIFLNENINSILKHYNLRKTD